MPDGTARAGRQPNAPAVAGLRIIAAAVIGTMVIGAVRLHGPVGTTEQLGAGSAGAPEAVQEPGEIVRMIGCDTVRHFAVAPPAIDGFTCATVTGSAATVFLYHSAPPRAAVGQKSGRACNYARARGLDAAWIAVSTNWLAWSLDERMLASLAPSHASNRALDCRGWR